MTVLAARLDPCVNWFKWIARMRRHIFLILSAALLAGYIASLSRTNWVGGLRTQAVLREANAPLLAEARRLNLDFDRVVADPDFAVGKPVVWCVDSHDGRTGFVASRQNWPVVWRDPSDTLQTNNGSYAYCWSFLAVVEGVDRGVVKLRPVERL